MIEIEEAPTVAACATCTKPLVWMYSYRLNKPVAFTPDPTNIRRIEVHSCDRWGLPPPTWRELQRRPPELVHAGARRVRQALEKTQREGNTP